MNAIKGLHLIHDLVVIGGGVIGCAVTRAALLQYPHLRVCLIEKEPALSSHQSGRSSGVVHVGYNQRPGTLKAKYVVEGSRRVRQFCRERHVPLVEDGILVVARDEKDIEPLTELHRRGEANGAKVELIDERSLREHEPYAAGIAALFAPEGASFDAKGFVNALALEAKSFGGQIACSEAVTHLRETTSEIEVQTTKRMVRARVVINAAGLHADRLAKQLGLGRSYQIIPFKGEYHELIPERRHMVRSHIYPLPDLDFPFLGVHFSRTFDGRVRVGPGAVLALGRESYDRFSCDAPDLAGMLAYPGFWRMWASRRFRTIAGHEWKKSLLKRAVAEEARRLLPTLQARDLVRSPSGIRAQLVARNGHLVEDLVIEETPRSLHLLNAVSPALTCSLPYAEHVASLITPKLYA